MVVRLPVHAPHPRLRVVYRMTSLKYLDSRPVSAAEKKEAARVGPFLKVVRPSDDGVRASWMKAVRG